MSRRRDIIVAPVSQGPSPNKQDLTTGTSNEFSESCGNFVTRQQKLIAIVRPEKLRQTSVIKINTQYSAHTSASRDVTGMTAIYNRNYVGTTVRE